MKRIGAHTGFDESFVKELNCEIAQVFLSSPITWERRKISNLKLSIPFYVHGKYLCRLDSDNSRAKKRSYDNLFEEYKIALGMKGFQGFVIHIAKFHNMVCDIPFVFGKREGLCASDFFLENSSSTNCYELLDFAVEYNFNICFDTAHAFQFGLSIKQMKKFLNDDRIGLVHLNNSGAAKGSKRDVHAPLLDGVISKKDILNLAYVLLNRNSSVDVIREVPRENWKQEIEMLKKVRTLKKIRG